MTISLFKAWVYGQKDYIQRLIEVSTDVETYLNQIFGQLTGPVSQLAVPLGLQEIFDRRGLIGDGSYDFSEGTLTGPSYNLTIQPGAYWNNGTFYYKTTTTILSMAGKSNGTYYVNLDAGGTPLISSSPDETSTRSFSWNGSAVSSKALYTGVNILFDGDDYADCLTSTARSKTFTRIATRLEELEAMVAEMGAFYALDHITGLNVYYKAGKCRDAESQVHDTVAGNVTCTDDTTNYIEVVPTTGVVSVNQTGFTTGNIPLFLAVAASGVVSITDVRTWACVGGGGAGDIEELEDYSDESTIVGWASFTKKKIQYHRRGNLLVVLFEISGVSNSTSTSFTVPYILRNDADADMLNKCYTMDNDIALDGGQAWLQHNTDVVYIAKNPAMEDWTASGTKAIQGILVLITSGHDGGGGGGGGHTQGTDLGTTAPTFTIDTDATGSPTGRAGLEVENGDDDNAAIKFNRDASPPRWEYTVDGGATWQVLGEVDMDLGGQELHKTVFVDDPPKVLDDNARGSSADYEELDLSSFITDAPDGVAGVVLRVRFWDSAPGIGVNAMFRRKGATGAPAQAFTFWGSELDPGVIMIGVDDTPAIEFFVNASGADTANLQAHLLGYFKIVQGTGSQKVTFTSTSLEVLHGATTLFNLSGFFKRGMAYSIRVQETGGLVTGDYDIGVYAKDTCGGAGGPALTDADKLYLALGIDPAADSRIYEDSMSGWRLEDEDDTNELHVKIKNNDGSQTGTYVVTIVAERFA